jgi:uncharacterized protein (TIGR02246 family)
LIPYTTFEELADVDAIARLTARYARLLDMQDLDGLIDLFTEDGIYNANEGELLVSGREELRQLFGGLMNGKWSTSHMVACPDVISLEPEAARVMWKMEYWSHFLELGVERRGTVVYDNEYSKTQGGWRIKAMTYQFLFETVTPLRPEPDLKVNPKFLRNHQP